MNKGVDGCGESCGQHADSVGRCRVVSGEEFEVETLRWARERMKEDERECDKVVRENLSRRDPIHPQVER